MDRNADATASARSGQKCGHSKMTYDILITGGGIVGLATALEILNQTPHTKLCLLEKEAEVGCHQTGNNSGVIHSGLYYKPGSAKAKTCIEGHRRMVEFCSQHAITHSLCGKIVVATTEEELPRLAELLRRGQENGVPNIREIGPDEIKEHEPHATGIRGLWVPSTGIVDYAAVARKYAELIRVAGGTVLTQTHVFNAILQPDKTWIVKTSKGDFATHRTINCAGLHCDRIARASGVNPGLQIVPFRGEYYKLTPASEHLVKGLIYPIPDPRFPFLGVHFTRMAAGGVEAGPNAVLAFKREGYRKMQISLRDSFETLTYRGFWRMAMKYWRTGYMEMVRSFSKAAFVRALRRLIPEIQSSDLVSGGAGVRAQALLPNGSMVDDFQIVQGINAIHVLNAPSPAATASLAIGSQIAHLLVDQKKSTL
jgi:L-2-hydroxyglutarate oxidase